MPTLYLIHGFVGAGKTTFAKKLAAETGAMRFSPDEWMINFYGSNPPADKFREYDDRVQDMIRRVASDVLARGHSVIFDHGFWTRESRDRYRAFGRAAGADVVLYALECPDDVIRARVQKRTHDMPDGALFIDDNAINLFRQRFEPFDPATEDGIIIDSR